jgi:hypothetical protein
MPVMFCWYPSRAPAIACRIRRTSLLMLPAHAWTSVSMAFRILVLGGLVACNGKNGDSASSGDDSTPASDADGDGVSVDAGDCNDTDAAVHPGASEACDGIDNNCDGAVDESVGVTFYADGDGDGYGTEGSAVVECEMPTGYAADAGDCDEGDPAINPGAQEICDAADVDEDCDGLLDSNDPSIAGTTTYHPDADLDGYGDAATDILACEQPAGALTDGGDCDDGNAAAHPGGIEVCDGSGSDEDCDGLADDADPDVTRSDYWPDADGDGHGDASATVTSTCVDLSAKGYVSSHNDCDDANPSVHPGATEVCDASDLDEDCNGAVDEDDESVVVQTWYPDADGDGFGSNTKPGTSSCDPLLAGYAFIFGDCDDGDGATNPSVYELCDDAIDNDCDGTIDDCSVVTAAAADATVMGAPYTGTADDLSAIGDVDGDGVADLAVASYAFDSDSGAVYVEYGPLSGDTTTASAAITITGTTTSGYFGYSLNGEGDVDDDGYVDMVVGAFGADRAYLFAGPLDAHSSAADADVEFTPIATGDQFGSTVDLAGDLNGDGYDDVLVSASAAYVSLDPGVGAAYLFEGPLSGSVDASSAVTTFTGTDASERATVGTTRNAVGDVDANGVDDLLVTAASKDVAGTDEGRAYLMYGGTIAHGPMTLESAYDAIMTGETSSSYFGYSTADRADYDDDGYDDVIVSAFNWGTTLSNNGCVYVFLGPVSGSVAGADADARWEGTADNENAGTSLSAADLDGDGPDDLIVGAYQHVGGTGSMTGGAFIALGGSTGTMSLNNAYAVIQGEVANDYFGYRVDGIPDWDGDGGAELVATSWYYAYGTLLPHTGKTYVFESGSLFP